MNHWITDLPLSSVSKHSGSAWFLFHFLRLLGWKLEAECDTASITVCSHITDGCMDDAGIANWSTVGTATRAKSDAQKYSGYRSLTFTTSATGDGVQSASFVSMEASKAYVFTIWVWNNCGHQLKVYIDNGNGSYVLAGAVPDNGGVWTKYQFSYTSHSTVTACKFKIVSEDGTVSAEQVYVDSASTCRSWYEARIRGSGTDGVIETGNNTFSTASYSFTDADITTERFVCLVDLTHVGNSGIYKVLSRTGTKAILDIRDDGTSFLTAATGLAFRILDPTDIPVAGPTSVGGSGSGFCLESPHSSKWRWKHRLASIYIYGADYGLDRWASSPENCALNTDTFQFYTDDQRSTSRYIALDKSEVYRPAAADYYGCVGLLISSPVHPIRFSLLTDGETFTLGTFRYAGATQVHTAFFMGFLGDARRPFSDTFVHLQQKDGTAQVVSLYFNNLTYAWTYWGCAFGKYGLAAQTCLASAGMGTGTVTTEGMTNAKANPWSGKESIRPFMAFVDWAGLLGQFSLIESTNQNFGHCRTNLALWSPFGTNKEWFHAFQGLCYAWHGRGVVI